MQHTPPPTPPPPSSGRRLRRPAIGLVALLLPATAIAVWPGADPATDHAAAPAASPVEASTAETIAGVPSGSGAADFSGPAEADRSGLPAGSIVIGPSVASAPAEAVDTSVVAARADDGATSPLSGEAVAPPEGLYPGDHVFWDGSFVKQGNVRNAGLCDVAGPCFEYPLLVQPGGARLRVAIDTPSREDTFRVEIVDPHGTTVASTSNGNQFNAEAFRLDPDGGDYVVVVMPQSVEEASFRMRAKLEKTVPSAPAGRVAMLPNLQVVPPYEFGFVAPVTPNGSYPPDAANPPASAFGKDLYSCTQDEAAPIEAGGSGAVDCLRLTSGPMNVGTGPFDMRFTFVDDMADGTAEPAYLRGPIFQTIHYSDGTEEYRQAGTYIFHTTHAHFHDENILTYEGFDVVDVDTGELARFGSGTKSGFCPADQLFGDWFSFTQAIRGDFGEGDSPTGNCFDVKDGLLGLTSGWGDVYRWQRPGQYVEFGGKGDGLYVIRSTVDAADHILETDETDNTSYAYIKVVNRTVDIIERGQGLSPWDPDKVVFEGDGPASVR